MLNDSAWALDLGTAAAVDVSDRGCKRAGRASLRRRPGLHLVSRRSFLQATSGEVGDTELTRQLCPMMTMRAYCTCITKMLAVCARWCSVCHVSPDETDVAVLQVSEALRRDSPEQLSQPLRPTLEQHPSRGHRQLLQHGASTIAETKSPPGFPKPYFRFRAHVAWLVGAQRNLR